MLKCGHSLVLLSLQQQTHMERKRNRAYGELLIFISNNITTAGRDNIITLTGLDEDQKQLIKKACKPSLELLTQLEQCFDPFLCKTDLSQIKDLLVGNCANPSEVFDRIGEYERKYQNKRITSYHSPPSHTRDNIHEASIDVFIGFSDLSRKTIARMMLLCDRTEIEKIEEAEHPGEEFFTKWLPNYTIPIYGELGRIRCITVPMNPTDKKDKMDLTFAVALLRYCGENLLAEKVENYQRIRGDKTRPGVPSRFDETGRQDLIVRDNILRALEPLLSNKSVYTRLRCRRVDTVEMDEHFWPAYYIYSKLRATISAGNPSEEKVFYDKLASIGRAAGQTGNQFVALVENMSQLFLGQSNCTVSPASTIKFERMQQTLEMKVNIAFMHMKAQNAIHAAIMIGFSDGDINSLEDEKRPGVKLHEKMKQNYFIPGTKLLCISYDPLDYSFAQQILEKLEEGTAATAVHKLQELNGMRRKGIPDLSYPVFEKTVFKADIAVAICDLTEDEKCVLAGVIGDYFSSDKFICAPSPGYYLLRHLNSQYGDDTYAQLAMRLETIGLKKDLVARLRNFETGNRNR